MNKDYYKVLGVDNSATEADIKKAYRKLAHQYHPDKKDGNESKFKEVSEAYSVLSNKEKRAQYDRFGKTFDGAGGGSPFGPGFDFRGFADGFEFGFDGRNHEDAGNMSDIFDAFFEGLGVKKRKTYKRGADLQFQQEITLEEAFTGIKKIIKYKTFIACKKCSGVGHFPDEGIKPCAACDGRGEIKEARNTFFGNFSQIKNCDKCHGTGQIPNKICKDCDGVGRITGGNEINVNIIPGIADGQMIKVPKAGEKGERGAESGDLYVAIRVKQSSAFHRVGDDLLVKKEINLVDVLLEKQMEIDSISGKKLSVKISSGANLKDKIVIAGEGMPKLGGYGRGNLLVDLDVRAPKKLSSKAKKLLEDLDQEIS
ncbi:MAG: DnaJ C-terminal domain-containing protein [bacterium]|nr:DnaJ C-terminal domain-containing protein [bacterium]